MTATHLLRESTIGQILNWATKGRVLPYPDQRPDYIVPARFLKGAFDSRASTLAPGGNSPRTQADNATLVDAEEAAAAALKVKNEGAAAEDLEKGASEPELPPAAISAYPYLVTWDENDPDNPQ